MSDLKPCPFCGGGVVIHKPRIVLGDDDADVDYLRPYCAKCGTLGGMHRFTNHDPKSDDFLIARSKAIAAWNTRADTAKDAKIAWLREALVEAVIPLEALFLSHTIKDFSPEMWGGIVSGIKAARQALATDQIETSGFVDCEASHDA